MFIHIPTFYPFQMSLQYDLTRSNRRKNVLNVSEYFNARRLLLNKKNILIKYIASQGSLPADVLEIILNYCFPSIREYIQYTLVNIFATCKSRYNFNIWGDEYIRDRNFDPDTTNVWRFQFNQWDSLKMCASNCNICGNYLHALMQTSLNNNFTKLSKFLNNKLRRYIDDNDDIWFGVGNGMKFISNIECFCDDSLMYNEIY